MVRQINIEGNHYPISTMTYMEDDEARLTLAVDHAMGATSWQRGWLEVMVDRRSTFDDARGMGEGVLDNRQTRHRYWLLYEPKTDVEDVGEDHLSLPSQVASALSRQLSSPSVQFVGATTDAFRSARSMLASSSSWPCDLHLLNLRTLSDPSFPDSAPSDEALAVLHSQGSDCGLNPVPSCSRAEKGLEVDLEGLEVKRATRTALTGVADKRNRKREVHTDLADLKVEPMTLESVKLTF